MEVMKYSKKYIYYSFLIASFFSLIILSMFSSMCFDEEMINYSGFLGVDSSKELLLGLLIVFVIYETIAFGFCYLNWKMISYEIGEENITLKKGIIYKKKIVVPYIKMHAVTIERNLFIRFFKLSTLNIDSGNASKSHENEIVIVLDKELINNLEKRIKEKITLSKSLDRVKDENGLKENEDKAKEILKEEFSKNKYIDNIYNKKLRKELVFGGVGFRIYSLIMLTITIFTIFAIIISEGFSLTTIFVGLFIYFVILLVVTWFSELHYYIKYYNYKLEYNDDEIIVSNGLITQHRHSYSRNKIKGIILSSDVVQMKRGYGTLKVELVGLGISNESDDDFDNCLVPLGKIDDLKKIMNKLDLGINYQEIPNNVSERSLIYFISIPSISLFGIFLPFILSFITTYISLIILGLYLLICLIILIFKVIEKKHQGITFDQKNLYFSNGCLVKKNYLIPWKSVVSIGTFSTPIRIKKGIVSICIDYYTSKGISNKKVYMIDEKTYAEILLFFESIKNK